MDSFNDPQNSIDSSQKIQCLNLSINVTIGDILIPNQSLVYQIRACDKGLHSLKRISAEKADQQTSIKIHGNSCDVDSVQMAIFRPIITWLNAYFFKNNKQNKTSLNALNNEPWMLLCPFEKLKYCKFFKNYSLSF